MEAQINKIEILIANFLSGESTPSESEELKRWVDESSANKKLFEANKRIWEKSPNYFSSPEILSDQGKIMDQIIQRLTEPPKKLNLSVWIYRVAAILALPVMFGIGWYLGSVRSNTETSELAMQEVTSPVGIRSQVVLPDGSKVWLNAESTLKFPVPFPKDVRNVDLKGEAFFEVTKKQEHPFVVHLGNVAVKVLGTTFDCKAFEGDKNIEVILEEGRVALNSNVASGQKESILIPGDRAIIEKATGETQIKNENIGKYIAWHTGKLVFDNTSMAEVVSMLERWYGVVVVVQDKDILNYRFTTTFDNESIFHVIELLSLSSPIQMKYILASIGKDNKTQTRAKVIISKK
jgi:transmembrane sensor